MQIKICHSLPTTLFVFCSSPQDPCCFPYVCSFFSSLRLLFSPLTGLSPLVLDSLPICLLRSCPSCLLSEEQLCWLFDSLTKILAAVKDAITQQKPGAIKSRPTFDYLSSNRVSVLGILDGGHQDTALINPDCQLSE